MAKVVQGNGILFKEDIKIIDEELVKPLVLPQFNALYEDKPLILYKGHAFSISNLSLNSNSGSCSNNESYIKIYTTSQELQEIDSVKKQEQKYLSDNSAEFEKVKKEFIERAVEGISVDNPTYNQQISAEVLDKISKGYDFKKLALEKISKGSLDDLTEESVLGFVLGESRLMINDKKVYNLMTIPEYIAPFEKSMEKEFYQKLQNFCEKEDPEKIFEMITSNLTKMDQKAMPIFRNPIWHSPRSFKLYLDKNYWIPYYREKFETFAEKYQKAFELAIKTYSVEKYLGGKK
jgi:hypothetical protein